MRVLWNQNIYKNNEVLIMSQQQQVTSNEWWSFSLFRLLGYGLLILALFDIVDIFYPSRFLNSAWEF
jgi:hypothetical protein